MSENKDDKNEFLYEKIKERPVNKKKLLRRTIITASLAVVFGLIACLTFLLLEPVISNWLYPKEKPSVVVFPEDDNELTPEDMLTENMHMEGIGTEGETEVLIDNAEIDEILNNITLGKDNYRQLYSSLKNYTDKISKSLVKISGETSKVDWLYNMDTSEKTTSGVVIANNGVELLILTYYQPIVDSEEINVTFNNNFVASGTLKEKDSKTNLAIVSVSLSEFEESMVGTDIVVGSFGISKVSTIIGTPVVAVGSPMGSIGSVDYGMITAVKTANKNIDTNYKLLQTNILGSKNSAGFIFNLYGQIVGVITDNTPDNGMNSVIYAYGITELKKEIEKMSNGVKLPYLGLEGLDVTEEANKKSNVPMGAYITEVAMNSPAMRAGIWQGDVVIAINDITIDSYTSYSTEILKFNEGDSINITVMRQSQDSYKSMNFEIELESSN